MPRAGTVDVKRLISRQDLLMQNRHRVSGSPAIARAPLTHIMHQDLLMQNRHRVFGSPVVAQGANNLYLQNWYTAFDSPARQRVDRTGLPILYQVLPAKSGLALCGGEDRERLAIAAGCMLQMDSGSLLHVSDRRPTARQSRAPCGSEILIYLIVVVVLVVSSLLARDDGFLVVSPAAMASTLTEN